MSLDRDEAGAQRNLIGEMMKDCESMQDEALALQVRSAVSHDGLVISLVPFLLSLSKHGEGAGFGRRNSSVKTKEHDFLS